MVIRFEEFVLFLFWSMTVGYLNAQICKSQDKWKNRIIEVKKEDSKIKDIHVKTIVKIQIDAQEKISPMKARKETAELNCKHGKMKSLPPNDVKTQHGHGKRVQRQHNNQPPKPKSAKNHKKA